MRGKGNGKLLKSCGDPHSKTRRPELTVCKVMGDARIYAEFSRQSITQEAELNSCCARWGAKFSQTYLATGDIEYETS